MNDSAPTAKSRYPEDLPPVVFVGPMGSGKSTAAQLLIDHLHYTKVSFAKKLKAICAELFGPEKGAQRGVLQGIGMAFRHFDPDVWADYLATQIRASVETDAHFFNGVFNYTCDDCRFENEVAALRGTGTRPVFVKMELDEDERYARLQANGRIQDRAQMDDESEHGLDNFEPDYVIDYNGKTQEDLLESVIQIINEVRNERA